MLQTTVERFPVRVYTFSESLSLPLAFSIELFKSEILAVFAPFWCRWKGVPNSKVGTEKSRVASKKFADRKINYRSLIRVADIWGEKTLY
jgi:hypothetical protein